MIDPDANQIKAAGGLLFHVPEETETPHILLIYRNDVWDLPKGKLEDDESISECAVREVGEEIGLSKNPDILADLGTTRHTYTIKDRLIEKETFWFLMRLNQHRDKFTPQEAEGITKVEWAPVDAALEKVGYQNLKDVIQRFTDNLENLKAVGQ